MGEADDQFMRQVRENVALTDASYLSLGRYFFEFSRTLYWMRTSISDYLASPEKPRRLVELLLGQMTAEPLTNGYFAICFEAANLTESDKAIGVGLRNEFTNLILKRNDYAHGDFHLGTRGMGLPLRRPDSAQGEPRLERIKPTRKEDPITTKEWSPLVLDEAMGELVEARSHILEYGDFCLHTLNLDWGAPDVQIGDVFVKRTKRGPVERQERFATLFHSFT